MSEAMYTEEEFKEFKELVEMSGSNHQVERISARLEMPKFIEKHGKEKCDAMWESIPEEWK